MNGSISTGGCREWIIDLGPDSAGNPIAPTEANIGKLPVDIKRRRVPQAVSPILADHQNRHLAVCQNFRGLAAEQQPAHTAPPVRSHHDQVAAAAGRRFQDRRRR